jgi:hypothetical protein
MKILKRLFMLPIFCVMYIIGSLILVIWGILTLSSVPFIVTWVISGDINWWIDIALRIIKFLNDHTFNI